MPARKVRKNKVLLAAVIPLAATMAATPSVALSADVATTASAAKKAPAKKAPAKKSPADRLIACEKSGGLADFCGP